MLKLLKIDTAILKELFALALPMVISQGAFALMIFCDRYFLSMLSPTHMSAGLGGGVAIYMTLSLFIGILAYTNAQVAQAYGAGRFAECSRSATQGFIFAVLSAPAVAVLGLLVGQLFGWFGHPPEQVKLETDYLNILLLGALLPLLKTAIGSYFAGIGRTRVVMIGDVFGVLINIPLTYALVFGRWGLPEWGIAGAAISTVLSNAAALAVFVAFYFERSHYRQFRVAESWRYDPALSRRLLRFGFPSGLEGLLNMGSFNLFVLLYQSFGIVAGASMAIVFSWDILSFVPMMGLNIALMSMAGRYVGAGDYDRLEPVIRAGFLLGLGYSGLMALIFVFAREPMVAAFVTGSHADEARQIQELAQFMMLGLAGYTMADAVVLAVGGVLKGAGDTRWLARTSVAMHWLMLIAAAVASRILGYGALTVWWLLVAIILSMALVYLLRLRGQRWRDPEVLAQVVA